MRLNRLLPCVLVVAACGDNSSGPTPLHPIDAAKQIDAPDIDGPPINTGDGSRVWAVGDYLVDATLNGAGFKDGDVLPFDTATPPGVVLPGGTSVFPSGTGVQKAGVFDATKTKTAFLADLTTAGKFDIYVADADGANPVKIVDNTFAPTLASVQLSPDGTKLAFTADPALATMFDMFIVSTDGTGTPVQVSPTRAVNAANLDVFFAGTWSADSKFFAFDGNFVVASAAQAYVVDTTAATPTAVKLLADGVVVDGVGVRGQMQFDDQNRVYFRFQTAKNVSMQFPQPFHMIVVDPDGNNSVLDPAFLPMRGDNTVASVGPFMITPDGKTIVFSADAPAAETFNLFSVATGSTDTAVNLTSSTAVAVVPTPVEPSPFQPMWFSPDGKSIAVAANYTTPGDNEPYVVKLDGTGMSRLVDINASVTGGCASNCDINILQWTDDAKSIYAMGDIKVANDTAIFKLDAGKTDQAPVEAIKVPMNGDFNQLIIRN